MPSCEVTVLINSPDITTSKTRGNGRRHGTLPPLPRRVRIQHAIPELHRERLQDDGGCPASEALAGG
jgi:hypothetical protein